MKTAALVLVVTVAAALSFVVACVAAWALTAIWPSLPFWPVTFLAWVVISVFSRSSSSSS
jgi:hypothetical protein